jgi:beta-galactosidase
MDKLREIAILSILMLPMALSAQQRIVTSLDFGWEFSRDSLFTNVEIVDVPHDFQITQPWVAPEAGDTGDADDPAANIKSRLSSRGFKETGKGYYRLHYTPSPKLKGRRVLLDFEGVMYTADVLLNGQRIGGTDYGYVGFEIDITDRLNYDGDNLIEVIADTREPGNSRWYTGGGLFRYVSIVSTPKDIFFNRHPLYITTRDNRFVSISAEFTNRTQSGTTHIAWQILDAEGKVVGCDTTHLKRHRMTRHQEERIATDIEISHPKIWDLDTPYLYYVRAKLLRDDGTVADETCDQFGIRTIEFSPGFGFKLNGRKVLLKGYANHHSLGALGAAAYPKAIEKRILLMKKFGMNHIRTSHNPYSRDFIRLCDKHGILLVDELYDKWTRQHTGGKVPFEQLWQYDVPEWVKRDRNSPCVILWSLGNELQQDPNQPFNDFGMTMYKLQKTLLQRYDSTRLVTVAMHPRYRNWETDSLPHDLAMITDVQAYNYRYMYFPGDGRRFPWMKFYQSEASVAAMGPNWFEMDLDKVIGLAYWGAIDYLGESQGWPAKGWSQGVFDITLEPKPKAFFMKSFFTDEPTVHIAVVESDRNDVEWNGVQTGNAILSENWNRTDGTTVDLFTFTNGEEVELLLSGKRLGRQKNAADPKFRNQIIWKDIPYQAGRLEAIAYRSGKVIARHAIETTGKAVRLVVTPEDQIWQADGMDLQHLRITALDNKGRRVLSADDELTFEVEGDAQIVAVGNGDMDSEELNVTNHRRLYNGSALVILRAGLQPSKVTLRTASNRFKTVTTKLETDEKITMSHFGN